MFSIVRPDNDHSRVNFEKSVMSRLRPAGTLVILLAVALASCNSHSSVLPTAPSSTSPQVPARGPIAGERWNLTTTLTSATGPEGCVLDLAGSDLSIGQSSDWQMAVERSGESIHLVVYEADDPSDRFDYQGTAVAGVLTILSSFTGFTRSGWCGGERGGQVAFRTKLEISGRFSSDGHTLTAREVVSSEHSSGGTFIFRYDWNATQQ